jgi:hypothetical protein
MKLDRPVKFFVRNISAVDLQQEADELGIHRHDG